MPYPNRPQWVIIWTVAIVAFYIWDRRGFFESLGGYNGEGVWLWPIWVSHDAKIVPAFIIAGLLLLWQFSRPVRLWSPILLPISFVIVCVVWYAVGAIQQAERERPIKELIQRMRSE
jgi:hypothetical protein